MEDTVQTDISTVDVSTAPVLELILLRVRLRAGRRAAWMAHLAGSTMGLPKSSETLDTPESEANWLQTADELQPITELLNIVEEILAGEGGSSLRHLAEMFELSELELDLLQICLAFAIDPSLSVVFGYLQQHSGGGCPTEALAARLFGYGRRLLWNPAGPLATWGWITAGESAAGQPVPLAVDPTLIAWFQGELRIDARLAGSIRMIEPCEPLENWPVDDAVQRIVRGLDRESSIRVLIGGPPLSGRRTFAAAVAKRFEVEAVAVDTDQIADADWPDLFMRAQRLAILGGTALVWHGSGLHRLWPMDVWPAPLQLIVCDVAEPIPPYPRAIDYRIDLPGPTLDERRKLWKTSIPESSAWPTGAFETVCERYRLNVGDILLVSRHTPSSPDEAAAFARELTRHRLGNLARLLDCPFAWNDLVLTEKLRESLEDFSFEARDRTSFWESPQTRRLFPRGTGLVALFSGPPGTGKTMATQVIAAELELDLFRVDLASVVSKYIGETAKHLAQIFARASTMNAVLLFDEADALFSKRTDVKDSHDRYANADTSYLLQLLEDYGGIVILASNKKQNIDPAFIRRIRYVFEFPRPDKPERAKIWRQVIGALTGDDVLKRLNGAIEALASTVEISGAQIKNAVLASIFIARNRREELAMPHLLRGVERELSKDGRSLAARDRERLVRNA
jgi:adenylate kinase family enzyme